MNMLYFLSFFYRLFVCFFDILIPVGILSHCAYDSYFEEDEAVERIGEKVGKLKGLLHGPSPDLKKSRE